MRRLGRRPRYVLSGLGYLWLLVFVGIVGYPIYRISLVVVERSGPWPVVLFLVVCVGALTFFVIYSERCARGLTLEEATRQYEAELDTWLGKANRQEYPSSVHGLGPNPGADPPDQPETPPPARRK